jgi:peptidoglycan/xylan/chitin deacetylase (PgdA/CDA1 family)
MRLPPDEPAPAKTDTPLPTREVPDTEQVETPEPPRMFESGLLLSFDDDYYAAWEAAFPLFDCYGARVTFFVQGNPAFCLLAEKRGHSIGYHTAAHSDLRRLDFDAWCDETTGSARLLLEKGVRLSAFAYPFGFFEEWMHEELRKTYPVLRGFGVRDLVYRRDGEELKRGFIGSKSIDNTVLQNDDDFFKTIDALFERAAVERGSLVPLTTHTIDDRAQWGIRPDRLEYILKRAGELGLRFYTYADLHPAPES